MMSKHILIIGGGVLGLCTAYYCARQGHRVTLVERGGEQRDGCSFGNAGVRSFATNWSVASGKSNRNTSFETGVRTSSSCTGTFERLIASSFIGNG